MPCFAANLSMMFNEAPFLDRFAAAAAAGGERGITWVPGWFRNLRAGVEAPVASE